MQRKSVWNSCSFLFLKGVACCSYFYCMDVFMDVFSQVKLWHLYLHKITRTGDNCCSEIAQRSCLEGSQEERHHVVAKWAFWHQLLFLFGNSWEEAKDLATLWSFQYDLKDDAKQMWTFLWKPILISWRKPCFFSTQLNIVFYWCIFLFCKIWFWKIVAYNT